MAGTGMSSIFPQGFKNGLILKGMPLVQAQPGNVYWVNNGTVLGKGEVAGSNGNDGTFYRPWATLQYALNQCLAGHGDIIFVKAGHAEAIPDAATLLFNKAGVAIIGLGSGAFRPTFTLTTAATANIPVTAANVSIQNCMFIANFADIASLFTVTGTALATDFNVEGCIFLDNASNLNFISLITGNATGASLTGFRFVGNRVSSLGTTAATTAIKILSDCSRVIIADNFGVSAVLNDTAAILAAGASQLTLFEFGRNVWERPNTSSTGGSFVSGTGNAWSGTAYDNYLYQVDVTAGIWISTGHGSAFGYQNNLSPITGAVDKSALINPAAV